MDLRLGVERHTFTILARCPRTGALGVGIATYSLGVGGYCPAISPGAGVLSSQAFADPRLRPIGIQILEAGSSIRMPHRSVLHHDYFCRFQISVLSQKLGD